MNLVRNLVPLSVILALGLGVACKKPAPAPAPVEPAAVAAPEPAPAPQTQTNDDDAARKAAEEAEAARKAEAERMAAFKAAAAAALKDINFEFDKSDIREVDKTKLQARPTRTPSSRSPATATSAAPWNTTWPWASGEPTPP
jgi:hypothetical protein